MLVYFVVYVFRYQAEGNNRKKPRLRNSVTQQQKACNENQLWCLFSIGITISQLSPVAERSKARFCGRSLAGIAGSNPAGAMDICLL
jgi:hypothetical protein